jgi:hypothetical protein
MLNGFSGGGQPWMLDAGAMRVLKPGTPVFIVGDYGFESAPPWHSLKWVSVPLELPSVPASAPDP